MMAYSDNYSTAHSNFIYSTILNVEHPNRGIGLQGNELAPQPRKIVPQAWFVNESDLQVDYGRQNHGVHGRGGGQMSSQPRHDPGGYKIAVRVVADISDKPGENVGGTMTTHNQGFPTQPMAQNVPWVPLLISGPPTIKLNASSEGAEVEILFSGKKFGTQEEQKETIARPRKRRPRNPHFLPGEGENVTLEEKEHLERYLCFEGLFKLEENPEVRALFGQDVFNRIRSCLSDTSMNRAQFEREIENYVTSGEALKHFRDFQGQIDDCMFLCHRLRTMDERWRCATSWFRED